MVIEYKDKKAIVFDLFGTLTNGQADPEARMIQKFNLPSSQEDYDKIAMFVCATKFQDYNSYLSTVVKGLGLPDNESTRSDIDAIFKEDLRGEQILPGVNGLLERLKQSGYTLGLISDIPNPKYNLLKAEGLERHFDALVFSYETGLLKPDREIMEITLRKLNQTKPNVIYVGNSVHSDIGLAIASGVDSILYDTNNKYPDFQGSRVNSLQELESLFI